MEEWRLAAGDWKIGGWGLEVEHGGLQLEIGRLETGGLEIGVCRTGAWALDPRRLDARSEALRHF